MIPGRYTLNLYRGDTAHWQFTLWSDADRTVPCDLTDVLVKSQIRDKPSGATIIELACTIELPNIIHIDLTATASAMLPLGGAWDLQLTYPNGDVATVVAGPVKVTPDVTDSTIGRQALRVAK